MLWNCSRISFAKTKSILDLTRRELLKDRPSFGFLILCFEILFLFVLSTLSFEVFNALIVFHLTRNFACCCTLRRPSFAIHLSVREEYSKLSSENWIDYIINCFQNLLIRIVQVFHCDSNTIFFKIETFKFVKYYSKPLSSNAPL